MDGSNQFSAPPPPLSAFIGAAIAEWHKRHADYVGGKPQAETAAVLGALAEVAGELVARLPSREQRRAARAGFEARFRRAHLALGRGKA